MRTHNSDTDTLIVALQGDLPSAEDDARMRARLSAAGACVGASIAGVAALKASGVEAAGLSATAVGAPGGVLAGTAGVKAAVGIAGAKGGFLSTLGAALPLAGGASVKTLVVAGAIATGLGYPLWAPEVSAVFHAVVPSQVVKREHGQPRVESAGDVVGANVVSAKVETGVATPAVARVADSARQTSPSLSDSTLRVTSVEARTDIASHKQVAEPSLRATSQGPRAGNAPVKLASAVQPNPALKLSVAEPVPSPVVEVNAAANGPTNVLAEETLLIERALKAERSGDKAAARNWLSVHQQRFPSGKLTIERNRMWAQLQD